MPLIENDYDVYGILFNVATEGVDSVKGVVKELSSTDEMAQKASGSLLNVHEMFELAGKSGKSFGESVSWIEGGGNEFVKFSRNAQEAAGKVRELTTSMLGDIEKLKGSGLPRSQQLEQGRNIFSQYKQSALQVRQQLLANEGPDALANVSRELGATKPEISLSRDREELEGRMSSFFNSEVGQLTRFGRQFDETREKAVAIVQDVNAKVNRGRAQLDRFTESIKAAVGPTADSYQGRLASAFGQIKSSTKDASLSADLARSNQEAARELEAIKRHAETSTQLGLERAKALTAFQAAQSAVSPERVVPQVLRQFPQGFKPVDVLLDIEARGNKITGERESFNNERFQRLATSPNYLNSPEYTRWNRLESLQIAASGLPHGGFDQGRFAKPSESWTDASGQVHEISREIESRKIFEGAQEHGTVPEPELAREFFRNLQTRIDEHAQLNQGPLQVGAWNAGWDIPLIAHSASRGDPEFIKNFLTQNKGKVEFAGAENPVIALSTLYAQQHQEEAARIWGRNVPGNVDEMRQRGAWSLGRLNQVLGIVNNPETLHEAQVDAPLARIVSNRGAAAFNEAAAQFHNAGNVDFDGIVHRLTDGKYSSAEEFFKDLHAPKAKENTTHVVGSGAAERLSQLPSENQILLQQARAHLELAQNIGQRLNLTSKQYNETMRGAASGVTDVYGRPLGQEVEQIASTPFRTHDPYKLLDQQYNGAYSEDAIQELMSADRGGPKGLQGKGKGSTADGGDEFQPRSEREDAVLMQQKLVHEAVARHLLGAANADDPRQARVVLEQYTAAMQQAKEEAGAGQLLYNRVIQPERRNRQDVGEVESQIREVADQRDPGLYKKAILFPGQVANELSDEERAARERAKEVVRDAPNADARDIKAKLEERIRQINKDLETSLSALAPADLATRAQVTSRAQEARELARMQAQDATYASRFGGQAQADLIRAGEEAKKAAVDQAQQAGKANLADRYEKEFGTKPYAQIRAQIEESIALKPEQKTGLINQLDAKHAAFLESGGAGDREIAEEIRRNISTRQDLERRVQAQQRLEAARNRKADELQRLGAPEEAARIRSTPAGNDEAARRILAARQEFERARNEVAPEVVQQNSLYQLRLEQIERARQRELARAEQYPDEAKPAAEINAQAERARQRAFEARRSNLYAATHGGRELTEVAAKAVDVQDEEVLKARERQRDEVFAEAAKRLGSVPGGAPIDDVRQMIREHPDLNHGQKQKTIAELEDYYQKNFVDKGKSYDSRNPPPAAEEETDYDAVRQAKLRQLEEKQRARLASLASFGDPSARPAATEEAPVTLEARMARIREAREKARKEAEEAAKVINNPQQQQQAGPGGNSEWIARQQEFQRQQLAAADATRSSRAQQIQEAQTQARREARLNVLVQTGLGGGSGADEDPGPTITPGSAYGQSAQRQIAKAQAAADQAARQYGRAMADVDDRALRTGERRLALEDRLQAAKAKTAQAQKAYEDAEILAQARIEERTEKRAKEEFLAQQKYELQQDKTDATIERKRAQQEAILAERNPAEGAAARKRWEEERTARATAVGTDISILETIRGKAADEEAGTPEQIGLREAEFTHKKNLRTADFEQFKENERAKVAAAKEAAEAAARSQVDVQEEVQQKLSQLNARARTRDDRAIQDATARRDAANERVAEAQRKYQRDAEKALDAEFSRRGETLQDTLMRTQRPTDFAAAKAAELESLRTGTPYREGIQPLQVSAAVRAQGEAIPAINNAPQAYQRMRDQIKKVYDDLEKIRNKNTREEEEELNRLASLRMKAQQAPPELKERANADLEANRVRAQERLTGTQSTYADSERAALEKIQAIRQQYSRNAVEEQKSRNRELLENNNQAAFNVTMQFAAAAAAAKEFIQETVLYAARTETMKIVTQHMAETNNINTESLNHQVLAVRSMMVTTQEAHGAIQRMIFAQLDAAKATKLAALAQDAATISGESASEALEKIITGITTGQTRMLHYMGIQVNMNQVLRETREQLGREPTEIEKRQALFNKVLDEGVKISGNFDVAMLTAGKQVLYLDRAVKEAQNSVGAEFQPALMSVISLLSKVANFVRENSSEFANLTRIIGGVTAAFLAFSTINFTRSAGAGLLTNIAEGIKRPQGLTGFAATGEAVAGEAAVAEGAVAGAAGTGLLSRLLGLRRANVAAQAAEAEGAVGGGLLARLFGFRKIAPAVAEVAPEAAAGAEMALAAKAARVGWLMNVGTLATSAGIGLGAATLLGGDPGAGAGAGLAITSLMRGSLPGVIAGIALGALTSSKSDKKIEGVKDTIASTKAQNQIELDTLSVQEATGEIDEQTYRESRKHYLDQNVRLLHAAEVQMAEIWTERARKAISDQQKFLGDYKNDLANGAKTPSFGNQLGSALNNNLNTLITLVTNPSEFKTEGGGDWFTGLKERALALHPGESVWHGLTRGNDSQTYDKSAEFFNVVAPRLRKQIQDAGDQITAAGIVPVKKTLENFDKFVDHLKQEKTGEDNNPLYNLELQIEQEAATATEALADKVRKSKEHVKELAERLIDKMITDPVEKARAEMNRDIAKLDNTEANKPIVDWFKKLGVAPGQRNPEYATYASLVDQQGRLGIDKQQLDLVTNLRDKYNITDERTEQARTGKLPGEEFAKYQADKAAYNEQIQRLGLQQTDVQGAVFRDLAKKISETETKNPVFRSRYEFDKTNDENQKQIAAEREAGLKLVRHDELTRDQQYALKAVEYENQYRSVTASPGGGVAQQRALVLAASTALFEAERKQHDERVAFIKKEFSAQEQGHALVSEQITSNEKLLEIDRQRHIQLEQINQQEKQNAQNYEISGIETRLQLEEAVINVQLDGNDQVMQRATALRDLQLKASQERFDKDGEYWQFVTRNQQISTSYELARINLQKQRVDQAKSEISTILDRTAGRSAQLRSAEAIGPYQQDTAIRQNYEEKKQYLDLEFALNKDNKEKLRELDRQAADADFEYLKQRMDLFKQQIEEGRKFAGDVFDTILNSRHPGENATKFFTKLFTGTEKQIFENVTGDLFTGMQRRLSIPGQGTMDHPTALGKALQGTMFGMHDDPRKEINALQERVQKEKEAVAKTMESMKEQEKLVDSTDKNVTASDRLREAIDKLREAQTNINNLKIVPQSGAVGANPAGVTDVNSAAKTTYGLPGTIPNGIPAPMLVGVTQAPGDNAPGGPGTPEEQVALAEQRKKAEADVHRILGLNKFYWKTPDDLVPSGYKKPDSEGTTYMLKDLEAGKVIPIPSSQAPAAPDISRQLNLGVGSGPGSLPPAPVANPDALLHAYTNLQEANAALRTPAPVKPKDAIDAAAEKYGVDSATMHRIAQIESQGNPSIVNKQSGAAGLFQFMPATAKAYGMDLDDRLDPEKASDAAARMIRDNTYTLKQKLGRPPTAADLYLAQQQGPLGAAELLNNPDENAVDAISKFYKDRKIAEKAIAQNGGSTSMTAGEFAGMWNKKFYDKQSASDFAIPLGEVGAPPKDYIEPVTIPPPYQPMPDVALFKRPDVSGGYTTNLPQIKQGSEAASNAFRIAGEGAQSIPSNQRGHQISSSGIGAAQATAQFFNRRHDDAQHLTVEQADKHLKEVQKRVDQGKATQEDLALAQSADRLAHANVDPGSAPHLPKNLPSWLRPAVTQMDKSFGWIPRERQSAEQMKQHAADVAQAQAQYRTAKAAVVGHPDNMTHEGLIINPDGSKSFPPGATRNSDGNMVLPSGAVVGISDDGKPGFVYRRADAASPVSAPPPGTASLDDRLGKPPAAAIGLTRQVNAQDVSLGSSSVKGPGSVTMPENDRLWNILHASVGLAAAGIGSIPDKKPPTDNSGEGYDPNSPDAGQDNVSATVDPNSAQAAGASQVNAAQGAGATSGGSSKPQGDAGSWAGIGAEVGAVGGSALGAAQEFGKGGTYHALGGIEALTPILSMIPVIGAFAPLIGAGAGLIRAIMGDPRENYKKLLEARLRQQKTYDPDVESRITDTSGQLISFDASGRPRENGLPTSGPTVEDPGFSAGYIAQNSPGWAGNPGVPQTPSTPSFVAPPPTISYNDSQVQAQTLGSGSKGSNTVHLNVSVQTMDSKSFMDNSGKIADAMKMQLALNHPVSGEVLQIARSA